MAATQRGLIYKPSTAGISTLAAMDTEFFQKCSTILIFTVTHLCVSLHLKPELNLYIISQEKPKS